MGTVVGEGVVALVMNKKESFMDQPSPAPALGYYPSQAIHGYIGSGKRRS